ncbi:NAD(P)/FAD-dependent oxidoreductase [Eremococcus coleocola]|uniref:Pyridine nucleotide-disulfide oxidoreductase n=1 Tax=Eremococcus coleocola ACS-139-V-Col8 TaxID=908337 RepID=E4KMM6_9LACT|nr:NAD(P)/FAD-dependent oxidoreductase [Eremococcus coleocola]EFR31699.1 pyridine nucleotide-disulfide oxidoreductase [Eremococcus coleocola ACS-139-V-Col8]
MQEIVVLGAGYAGLKTVVSLQKKSGDFHITLVDMNDYHCEATEIHEVAAGSVDRDKISYPIADVIHSNKVKFIQDQVTHIDKDQQVVTLKAQGQIKYDYLVVALGFVSETFGIKGAMENALQMVNIDTAEAVHNHILDRMKAYQTTKDPDDLKLVICGAGFTGIELAGAFVDERARYAQIAGVDPKEIQIICVEAAPKILPMFKEEMANYAIDLLDKLDVQLKLGCMIKEIQPGKVLYSTSKDSEELESITTSTIVWTTGVSGSPVMEDSGFKARRGRVIVADDLRDPDHDNVYIIGDVAAFMDKSSDRPFPTTAQIAIAMGEHVAKNLDHQLQGQATENFSFKSAGTVASVGNTRGLGVVGSTNLKGYPASFMKKIIMNKSLMDIGGLKEVFAKGRFDLYH